jgi:hypothetical protein
MHINWSRAGLAGLLATGVMTAVGLWVAPLMGIPAMNPAAMLAGAMGGSVALGWVGHLMIGTILALIYAVISPRLPGSPVVRGALYGLAPWLLAQLVVIPMMGMPLFSGSAGAPAVSRHWSGVVEPPMARRRSAASATLRWPSSAKRPGGFLMPAGVHDAAVMIRLSRRFHDRFKGCAPYCVRDREGG